MIVTIENNKFKAEIDSFGAEIQHFVKKADGTELIWNGDKAVWGNHAPILFPFVARCLDNHFIIEGKRWYNDPQFLEGRQPNRRFPRSSYNYKINYTCHS